MYKGKKGEKIKGPVFIPTHILNEAIVAIVVMGIIIILAGYFPFGLGSPADPFKTPEHIKPEWYFLPVYQLLKLIPEKLLGLRNASWAMIITFILFLVLMFLPWIDRSNPEVRHPLKRPLVTIVGVVVIVAAIALMLWGKMS